MSLQLLVDYIDYLCLVRKEPSKGANHQSPISNLHLPALQQEEEEVYAPTTNKPEAITVVLQTDFQRNGAVA
jgi:hypothetical protein